MKILLANLYIKFLEVVAEMLMYLSRLVGNQYTFFWPYLHRSSFDHRFDYLRGIENYSWYERAILGIQRIKAGGTVLDIGCGDGIYSGLFYSKKAKSIDAIDLDPNAIIQAKKLYQKSNVHYKNISIFDWLMKKNKYDTILMFAVIEHLSWDEGLEILKNISRSLNKDGIFYGSTALFSEKGGHNFEHQNEFFEENVLKGFLRKIFKKVDSYVSVWPNGRKECYFECRN